MGIEPKPGGYTISTVGPVIQLIVAFTASLIHSRTWAERSDMGTISRDTYTASCWNAMVQDEKLNFMAFELMPIDDHIPLLTFICAHL